MNIFFELVFLGEFREFLDSLLKEIQRVLIALLLDVAFRQTNVALGNECALGEFFRKLFQGILGFLVFLIFQERVAQEEIHVLGDFAFLVLFQAGFQIPDRFARLIVLQKPLGQNKPHRRGDVVSGMLLDELKIRVLGTFEVLGGNIALNAPEPSLRAEFDFRIKAHDTLEADPRFQKVAELFVGLRDLPQDAGVLGFLVRFLAGRLDPAVNVDGADVVAAAAVDLAEFVECGDAYILVIIRLQNVAHHLFRFLGLAVSYEDLSQNVGGGNEKLVVGVLGEVRDLLLGVVVAAFLDQNFGVFKVSGVSGRALGDFP